MPTTRTARSGRAGRAGPEPSEGPREAGEPEGEDRKQASDANRAEPESEDSKQASRSIYRGRIVDLSLDTVALPNGRTVDLELIHHPGAAAIVPIEADGQVVLVRQYRYATDGYLLEVPAGKLDGGETPEICAQRELVEECGRCAASLTPLGWIWTTPGFTNEKIWLFLARNLTPATQALEHDEVLTVERVPFTRALAMALSGEITDAKSAIALVRAASHLQEQS